MSIEYYPRDNLRQALAGSATRRPVWLTNAVTPASRSRYPMPPLDEGGLPGMRVIPEQALWAPLAWQEPTDGPNQPLMRRYYGGAPALSERDMWGRGREGIAAQVPDAAAFMPEALPPGRYWDWYGLDPEADWRIAREQERLREQWNERVQEEERQRAEDEGAGEYFPPPPPDFQFGADYELMSLLKAALAGYPVARGRN